MKGVLILLFILVAFAIVPMLSNAQTDAAAATNSPISQPLIREGTLAVKLVGELKLGTTENEAEAEDLLSAAFIAPRNGWIADYPVTPDIIGELQAAVIAAADSGKLSIGKDAALQAFQESVREYNLPVTADMTGRGDMSAPSYPDTAVANSYYYNEGPPTVTYYAPPPDYAYLYSWVPYPFWWWDFWFPGFFVLADFQFRVHWHHHGHYYEGFATNHFHDPRTGVTSRIDPATRVRGGTFPPESRPGWATPAARGGAQAVFDRGLARVGPAPGREFRGYGLTPRHGGAGSSAFEHSVNRQVEHTASDRGFRSRSSAGHLPHAVVPSVPHGGGAAIPRSGGSGGFHGGGWRR